MRKWYSANYANTKKVLFLGLGDSYDWNLKNFPKAKDIVILQPQSAGVDMCVLAQCHHTIMSVGTMGWWSAFLTGGRTYYQRAYAKPGTDLAKRRFKPLEYYFPNWIGL